MKRRDEQHEVTTIWQAVSRCLGWAVSIVLVCIGLALFKPQINRREKLDARIEALRTERDAMRKSHQAFKARLDWIKNDPAYLEVFARDRLDLARPGEAVFQFSAVK